jgi:hypothetical protein
VPQTGLFEATFRDLQVFIEYAVGAAAAAVRMAELRALAEANPEIAASFLAEELRRWRNWTGAVNPASAR